MGEAVKSRTVYSEKKAEKNFRHRMNKGSSKENRDWYERNQTNCTAQCAECL